MTEKQKREQIRAEIAKQYRDQIADLKHQIALRDKMILEFQKEIEMLKKQGTQLPKHMEAVRYLGKGVGIEVPEIVQYCLRSGIITGGMCTEQ